MWFDDTKEEDYVSNISNFIQIFKNVLPCNKLLSHFHYINHFISYKIINYYICGKSAHRKNLNSLFETNRETDVCACLSNMGRIFVLAVPTTAVQWTSMLKYVGRNT